MTSKEEGSYNTDCLYTGKLFDTDTELYYYGARYYDPELGRFIQPDTIVPYPSDPQSFNRYSYARNNPIKYIDPTGHSWWSAFWSFVAGLAGAVVAAVLTPVIGPVLGGMAGGAVSGAILGAIDGGLSGALKGAAWGAGIGGILGAGYAGFDSMGLGGAFLATAAVGGAAYAGAAGGLEGLGDFAAGAVGGFYGYTLGNALVNPSAYAQTQTEAQTGLSKSEQQETIRQRSAGQLTDPAGKTSNATPSALETQQKSKITSDLAKSGGVGKGNNPTIPTRSEARAFYNENVGPKGEMWMGIKAGATALGGLVIKGFGWIVKGIQWVNAELLLRTDKGMREHYDLYLNNPTNKSMALRELEAGTDFNIWKWNPWAH